MRASLLAALAILAIGCGAPDKPSNAPAGAQKIEVSLPVEEVDLANGLHVVFHPLKTSAGALVHIRYDVGSKDDPVGRSGFAHLFEHLMFRGSKDTGTRDYQQWLEEVGDASKLSGPGALGVGEPQIVRN